MKVLVTGAAGFIGAHLVRGLLAAGDSVTGVDHLGDYYDPALKHARLKALAIGGDFSFHALDVAAPEEAPPLAQRYDLVYHMAAQAGVRYSLQNPDAYIHANLVGFHRILEMCRRYEAGHLVYASSSSVYGLNTALPFAVGDNVDHPVSLYAATKKSNELLAHACAWLHGLPCTGLRFFTVYGPWGRPDMAYYSFTRDILAGRPLRVFNGGDLWRSFTYVDDVVACLLRLRDKPAAPDPAWDAAAPNPASSSAPYRLYNIGGDTTVQLTRMIAILEELLGRKAVIEAAPLPKTEVPVTRADTGDLAQHLGCVPATAIEDGLARFTAWYRDYHGEPR